MGRFHPTYKMQCDSHLFHLPQTKINYIGKENIVSQGRVQWQLSY